jgi:putative flippase GtrA
MSLVQYARFLATGGVVGAITVGCRELIGWLLSADNPARYSLSVVTAYAIGIVLSFIINRRYTFKDVGRIETGPSFLRFLAVALSGLLLTWLLSLTIRYETPWLIAGIGRYSATAAFAIATLISTAVTYPLNALVVFRRGRGAAQTARRDVARARGA